MDNLIQINYETENPTVSARELHEGLDVKTKFTDWFKRMAEYGFTEADYRKCFPNLGSGSNGGQNEVDYEISVDMAKQICMIQRTEKGRIYRQYFLDLEKAWNTPEQVFARALKLADKEIEKLKSDKTLLIEDLQRMKPKEIFADAVSASKTSILVGEMAKYLCQNGIDIGEKRMFTWLRDNGYLIKGDRADRNAPTQRAVKAGLIERKETVFIDGHGVSHVKPTPKITTKGQQYFINKFLSGNQGVM